MEPDVIVVDGGVADRVAPPDAPDATLESLTAGCSFGCPSSASSAQHVVSWFVAPDPSPEQHVPSMGAAQEEELWSARTAERIVVLRRTAGG